MPDTKTLNEEWLERSKRMFNRSVSEADITKSKGLWEVAIESESVRLEWLKERLNLLFLSASTEIEFKALNFCLRSLDGATCRAVDQVNQRSRS
jgi:hypothetical protein